MLLRDVKEGETINIVFDDYSEITVSIIVFENEVMALLMLYGTCVGEIPGMEC